MKKYLSILLFFVIFLTSLFVQAPKSKAGSFPAGSLLVQSGLESATVYYIGDDDKKYIFPDAKTYFTWYENFDDVKKVSVTELDQYPDGGIVPYRAGIKLITHKNTAKVYAVEPGGVIRWISSEDIAQNLYGEDWGLLVQDVLPGFFAASYTLGEDMADVLPTGTIVQEKSNKNYYYIENGLKRKVSGLDVLGLNNVSLDQIVEVANLSSYKNGPEVSYIESELTECHYKYKYKVSGNDEEDENNDNNNEPTQSAEIDLSLSKNLAYIYPNFEDVILIDVTLHDETGECIPYSYIYAYATQQENIEDSQKTAGGSYCGRALFVYRPTEVGEHSIRFSAVGVEKEISINVVEYNEDFVQVERSSANNDYLVAETEDVRVADIKFSNIIPFDSSVSLDSMTFNVTTTDWQDDFWVHANTYFGVIDSQLCTVGFCELTFDLNSYNLSQDERYSLYLTVDTPILGTEASMCIDYASGEFSTEAGAVSETILEDDFSCVSTTPSE